MSIERQTNKNATQKALSDWSTTNNITPERLSDLFCKVPKHEEYILNDALMAFITKSLFKRYEIIDDDNDILNHFYQIMENGELTNYTKEYIQNDKLRTDLIHLIDKIDATAKTRDCKASDFEEWTPEMKEYIKRNYSHWTSNYKDNEWSWGMVFFNFMRNWKYSYGTTIPYHCYAFSDESDVLFSRTKHSYNNNTGKYDFENGSSNSGCAIIIALFIVISSTLYTLL